MCLLGKAKYESYSNVWYVRNIGFNNEDNEHRMLD